MNFWLLGPVLLGFVVGLLVARLDEGVLGEDEARSRLLAWWAEQPESSVP